MFLQDTFLVRNFILLFVINSLYITLAQFYNLPKYFDSYWFYSFFFRESMLFCTYFAVFCVVWCIPFKWLQCVIVRLAVVASIILLFVNVFLAYNFGATLNDYLIGVGFETNPNESQEFLATYFDTTLAVIFAFLALLLFFAYKGAKYITKRLFDSINSINIADSKHIFKKSFTGGGKYIWMVFIVLFIILILIHSFRIRPPDERQSDVIYNAITSINDAYKGVRAQVAEFKNLSTNFESYTKSIKFTPIKDKIANVVLIIGESQQRNLMQLYGYYLPNTPNLATLHKNSPQNLLVFNDIIASQATTSESLSQALTFANQDDLETPWHSYLNIIDAVKLAGYKTIGISNQERYSVWAKASTSIFNRNDETHWLNVRSTFDNPKPDGDILPILDDVLAKKDNSSTFIALHLVGNHATYYKRYPKAFDIFSPSDINTPKHKKIIAEYANATAYNDFVVSEIFKRFSDSDSIVIYFSDHGEDVENARGHNDMKINRFMLEIPFIIYVSDTFINKHPKTYARLKEAQNRAFMLDDFMHSFIDILGFEIDGFEPNRSLFSKNFTPRKRMVGKKADKDYDADLRMP